MHFKIKKTKLANKIYLCTTKNKEDDKFIKVCKEHKINIFEEVKMMFSKD